MRWTMGNYHSALHKVYIGSFHLPHKFSFHSGSGQRACLWSPVRKGKCCPTAPPLYLTTLLDISPKGMSAQAGQLWHSTGINLVSGSLPAGAGFRLQRFLWQLLAPPSWGCKASFLGPAFDTAVSLGHSLLKELCPCHLESILTQKGPQGSPSPAD